MYNLWGHPVHIARNHPQYSFASLLSHDVLASVETYACWLLNTAITINVFTTSSFVFLHFSSCVIWSFSFRSCVFDFCIFRKNNKIYSLVTLSNVPKIACKIFKSVCFLLHISERKRCHLLWTVYAASDTFPT